MSRAESEYVGVDPDAAQAFLIRAARFLADANAEDLRPQSRQVLLHDAVLAACDAILLIKRLPDQRLHRGARAP